MRTRYFQDMPEEGELDGEYEPLDAILNPLRYSPVCCILFTNIYGSFKWPLISKAHNKTSFNDASDSNYIKSFSGLL